MLWKKSLKRFGRKAIDVVFFLGGEHKTGSENWRFRRRLIYGAYRLAVAMILFGMVTFFWDTGVSNQLVIGGVALLTIIVTAYTAAATWDDKSRVTYEEIELEP